MDMYSGGFFPYESLEDIISVTRISTMTEFSWLA